MSEVQRFVSCSCQGEKCNFSSEFLKCGAPAEHKVEETIFDDDPRPRRHPLTAYLCHKHFRAVMGDIVR